MPIDLGRHRVQVGAASADTDGASPLDRFMPAYDVAERHETAVAAPAAVTMAAARDMDIYRSTLVRLIFAIRTLPGRFRGAPPRAPASLLCETLALGWRVLADEHDRSVVVGAVTRPW